MFSLCWASCTGRKLWIVCSITSAIAACFLLASTLRQQAAEARSAATVDADPQGELVLVQVVFRHGARTPLTNLYWPEQQWASCTEQHPGSLNISLYDSAGGSDVPVIADLETAPDLPGGCKMGRLTDNGYVMAMHLGRALRQRYIRHYKLLPEQFDPATLKAETTAYQRTVETLRGVLTGLYPVVNMSIAMPQTASPSLNRAAAAEAVLPVATRWPEDEILIASNDTCPALPLLIAPFEEEQQRRAAADTYIRQLVQLISSAFHFPSALPFLWNRLRDTLACMAADGKDIPYARAARRYFRVLDYTATQRKLQLAAPEGGNCLGNKEDCQKVVQLSIGLLLSELAANMDSAVQSITSVPPAAAAVPTAGTLQTAADRADPAPAADGNVTAGIVAAAATAAAAAGGGGEGGLLTSNHSPTASPSAAAAGAAFNDASTIMATDAASALEALKRASLVVEGVTVGSATSTVDRTEPARPSMYANRMRNGPLVTKMMAQQYTPQIAASHHNFTSCSTTGRGSLSNNAVGRSGTAYHAGPKDKQSNPCSTSSMSSVLEQPSAAAEEQGADPGPPAWGKQPQVHWLALRAKHHRRMLASTAHVKEEISLPVFCDDDMHPLLFQGRQQLLDVSATAAEACALKYRHVPGKGGLTGWTLHRQLLDPNAPAAPAVDAPPVNATTLTRPTQSDGRFMSGPNISTTGSDELLVQQQQQQQQQRRQRQRQSQLQPHWQSLLQQDLQASIDQAAVEVSAGSAAAGSAGTTSTPTASAPNRKLYLYSAHDTTIMPLLTALGQQQHHWPPFADHVAFELWHQGHNNFYVRVVHNGKPLKFNMKSAHVTSSTSSGGSGSSSDRSAVLLVPGQASSTSSSANAGAGSTLVGGGSSGRTMQQQGPETTLPALLDFKQQVLGRYMISRHAHTAACQGVIINSAA